MEFGDVAFKGKGENRSTREQTQPTYDAGSENRTRDTLDPRSLRRKDALIQPYFDYCASVWDGLSSYLCEKLQKLQNRAARVILQASCEVNSSLLLETLQDLSSERHTDYDMRDSLRKLNLPKPRTDYLKRSFGYSGALLWNSLPGNIRAIRSIREFKKKINHVLKASDSHSAILFYSYFNF